MKMTLKRSFVFVLGFLAFAMAAHAQDRYFTKTGTVVFTSKAPLEDIVATNKTVTAVLDTKTSALQFSVQMKSFEFEKALMQEHFNDKYVESDKFPEAAFRGAVVGNTANYAKDGTYNVRVKGKLTIHNITKEVEVPGVIKVSNGKIEAISTFSVLASDYKIAIPSGVKEKVSNTIQIVVNAKLDPLK
ncbi:MAG TPA: YceI family protein [Flavisolibacter sp.]|nr:YceI family protein [Flavisolibacter sp.]